MTGMGGAIARWQHKRPLCPRKVQFIRRLADGSPPEDDPGGPSGMDEGQHRYQRSSLNRRRALLRPILMRSASAIVALSNQSAA